MCNWVLITVVVLLNGEEMEQKRKVLFPTESACIAESQARYAEPKRHQDADGIARIDWKCIPRPALHGDPQ